MILAYWFCAAILGAILGSFINALSFRYGTAESVLRGRSHCMQCRHELSAGDLIPVFSYLYVRGKCRYCGVHISIQYPLVEIAATFLSGFFFLQFGASIIFIFALAVSLTLLFALVYDLRQMLLPMEALVLLGVVSLGSLFFSCNSVCYAHMAGLWPLLSGPLLGGPLLLISLFSKGRWMGWGDGLLEVSLGWFLGLSEGLGALFIAFWSGAIVGIALILLKKRYTMKSEVPFAPFLIFGAAVAYIFHVDLFSLLAFS